MAPPGTCTATASATSWGGLTSRSVHVLLIEDDAEAAGLLMRGLRESGYTVDHAGDGREGLARALQGQFDLIVTDRMLPHLDVVFDEQYVHGARG